MKKTNFTPRVQKIISDSKKTAHALNSDFIDLNHLLFSVLDSDQSTIINFFDSIGISLDEFKSLVFNSIDGDFYKPMDSVELKEYSKDFTKVFKMSIELAEELDHDYVGIEHIFYVMLVYENSPFSQLLKNFHVDIEKSKDKLKNFFITGEWENARIQKTFEKTSSNKDSSEPSILHSFAKNYNELASEGKFDKVFCKDADIEKMSEILCRRNKNNPILIGLPGTGKTSLVEGLAQKIVNNTCTDFLANKTIYEVDMAAMIAGTKYRGQFEERMKNLIDEASKSPNIILFIDEIHTIVGAGATEGSMDAANILKPALARGAIRCIGATTPKEYNKNILKDAALERRFQEIKVNQPSSSETLKIIEGIISQYEKFHHVVYRKNALKLAVDLSIRYITDRQLPDKAIDIIDQAGARVKMKSFNKPLEAQKIEKQIENLMVKEDKSESSKGKYKNKQDVLLGKYKKVLNGWAESYKKKKFYVTQEDIFEVISSRTGVPVKNLSKKDSEILLNLKNKLSNEVLFQDHAVESVYNSIIRSKSGLSEENKPIGSFLLLGKTGVGKTFLAKSLASNFFGSKDNLIHIDMSEYSEKINISRLIGSSPGYIGYEDGGQLTDKIKNKPYSVVLFDEIEKAHPDVVNIFLQLLDEGRLTDNYGRVSDFSNCIVIMTSNIGSDLIEKSAGIGFAGSNFSTKKDKILDRAKSELSPEFINRIDDVIVFNDFSEANIGSLLDKEINLLKNNLLKDKGLDLNVSKKALYSLKDYVFNMKMGARPIKKIIQKNIENKVSEFIINHKSGKININVSDLNYE
jgi:ATP-dependent Clp protease ATP-binding subunit ClpC